MVHMKTVENSISLLDDLTKGGDHMEDHTYTLSSLGKDIDIDVAVRKSNNEHENVGELIPDVPMVPADVEPKKDQNEYKVNADKRMKRPEKIKHTWRVSVIRICKQTNNITDKIERNDRTSTTNIEANTETNPDPDDRYLYDVHFGKQTYESDIFKKRFTSSFKRWEQQKVHTGGDLPFCCDLCGHRFIQRTSLINHYRVHTGEKPFQCDKCGKCFTYRTTLTQHMKTHRGVKPFRCEKCNKRLTRKAHLLNHMKRDCSDKPFQCEVCEKSFIRKPNLVAHMQKHTDYKGQIC